MSYEKQSTRTEVDGDKLKLAREAQELALKRCLSHQHIARLEDNQLAIFFTHVHKLQVAKKVGMALGLSEDEYLIHEAIEMGANENVLVANPSFSPALSSESTAILSKSSIKPKIYNPRLLIIPAIVVSSMVIAAGSQIFSNELSALNLGQLISLKTPTSQLNAPLLIASDLRTSQSNRPALPKKLIPIICW